VLHLYPPSHVHLYTGTQVPITPFDEASEGTVRRERKIAVIQFF